MVEFHSIIDHIMKPFGRDTFLVNIPKINIDVIDNESFQHFGGGLSKGRK